MNKEKYANKQEQGAYQPEPAIPRIVERVPAAPGMFPDIPVFNRLPERIKSFRDLARVEVQAD